MHKIKGEEGRRFQSDGVTAISSSGGFPRSIAGPSLVPRAVTASLCAHCCL